MSFDNPCQFIAETFRTDIATWLSSFTSGCPLHDEPKATMQPQPQTPTNHQLTRPTYHGNQQLL